MTENILKISSDGAEEVVICVRQETICIYNTETDARAWCCHIDLDDWDSVKEFIDNRVKK